MNLVPGTLQMPCTAVCLALGSPGSRVASRSEHSDRGGGIAWDAARI